MSAPATPSVPPAPTTPTLYPGIFRPNQLATHVTLDNTDGPFTSSRATSDPAQPNLTVVWAPKPGTFGVVRGCWVQLRRGPGTALRGAQLLVQPIYPGLAHLVDGAVLAAAPDSEEPFLSNRGSGGPGPAPPTAGGSWTSWTAPTLLTPSTPIVLSTPLVAGDEAVYHVEVDVYDMVDGQSEVVLENLTDPANPTVTNVGGPDAGAWVPVATAVNLATGGWPGARDLSLFYGTTPEPGQPLLATTGPVSAPNVEENGGTGSYSRVGTASGDRNWHVPFPAAFAVLPGQNVYLNREVRPGDTATYGSVFLRTPVTNGPPLPPPPAPEPVTEGAPVEAAASAAGESEPAASYTNPGPDAVVVTVAPGPKVTFPLPGQEPVETLVLDNTSSPHVTTNTTNDPTNPPCAPIWTAPAGHFGILRSAKVNYHSGASELERGAAIYQRPEFPPNPVRGDGPYLAAARRVPSNTETDGYGGPAGTVVPPGASLTKWNGPMLSTPSVPLGLLTSQVAGDMVIWHIVVDVYTMLPGQREVSYNDLDTPTPVPPAGSKPKLLGEPRPGEAWLPVAAEVNVSTGPSEGVREGALIYGATDALTGTALAHTGPVSVPNVENNNATGSYAPNGSAPGDGKNHVQFEDNETIVAARVFVAIEGFEGDTYRDAAVFLATPVTVPTPPTSSVPTNVTLEPSSTAAVAPASGASAGGSVRSANPLRPQPSSPSGGTGFTAFREDLQRREASVKAREISVAQREADADRSFAIIDRIRTLEKAKHAPSGPPKTAWEKFRAWAFPKGR